MMTDRLVDVGGYALHARVQGSGPAVVLDGGGAGQGLGTWGPVPEGLAEFATVVTYDRAGVGRSGGTQAGSVVDMADDLRRLLRALDLDLPAVLVGWSYGGLVTQVYAARHPEDVAGLVLVDPTAAGTPPGSAVVRSSSFVLAAWLLRARAALGGRNARPLRELAVTLRGMPDAMAETARIREEHGLPPVPVRVITAGRRPRMPRAQLEHLTADHEALAALSPRGRVLVAEHASHQVPHDQPEVVLDAVGEVLRG
ncbi:alpha/beta fold hydrolase [Actinoalloteichus caeruleus]|uniref:Pimeloyl-ACP methyl ester carboxylesterase n=1 Tax=Actinoalloteichus caeruleus DSM 43889 TaxID=1120930 RepID=A0ABT1JE42_ACTCY|nr:alpha/beta hydrolase [Actinoalloteichus caeruleus]MCP2330762.1 Pimeloyl-ACP methyl ester carboxylesterase [Actinoalloteichus caeruleus DSM 43889]